MFFDESYACRLQWAGEGKGGGGGSAVGHVLHPRVFQRKRRLSLAVGGGKGGEGRGEIGFGSESDAFCLGRKMCFAKISFVVAGGGRGAGEGGRVVSF